MIGDAAALGIEAVKLCCERGDRRLFSDLSFALSAGQLLQVEGYNGSGKTSLLRTLCGVLAPASGEVRWCGEPIGDCRPEFYAQLSFIGHQPGIKLDLSALENLRFAQGLCGGVTDHALLMQALDQIGLYGFEELPCRQLSAGQRRRVALARLSVTTAALWILDEPFTALDRGGIQMLSAVLTKQVQAGGLVILTSHQPVELPEVRPMRLSLS